MSNKLVSDRDIDNAVALIAHRYAAEKQRHPQHPRVLVALAGRPGGGKSTAASVLASAVHAALGVEVCVMPMDGYHLYRSELDAMPNREEAYARRGAEWTFNPTKMARDLGRIAARDGSTVRVPSFDHALKDAKEEDIAIPGSAQVVVVEGNYVLYRGTPEWAAVNNFFDVNVFLFCERAVTVERLCRRHMHVWKITRAAAMVRAEGSDSMNGDLVDTTMKNADVVIRSLECSSLSKL